PHAPYPSYSLCPYTTLFRSSMAWAPNGKPSTATVADGVKGTVRINFNDGTYLDVPAAINVVKNNADQYIPAYKDTTVAAKSSVEDRKSTRLNSSHVSTSYAV